MYTHTHTAVCLQYILVHLVYSSPRTLQLFYDREQMWIGYTFIFALDTKIVFGQIVMMIVRNAVEKHIKILVNTY